MRLRHPDGTAVHIATLVPATGAKDVQHLLRLLDKQLAPQRRRLGVDTLNISLQLPPRLVSTLALSLGMRRRLRQELADRGFDLVTLDAGGPVSPLDGDWRGWLSYTLDLARIVVDLMPDDSVYGSVSTRLPATPDGAAQHEPEQWQTGVRLLGDLGAGLVEIAWHTGRLARVALEPAPFTPLAGINVVSRLLENVDRARIGFALNPRLLADTGETATRTLTQLRRARVSVVKLRVGSSLLDPGPRPVAVSCLEELFGGLHPECDHVEVDGSADLDGVHEELGVLGMAGAADPDRSAAHDQAA
jgi:hypothetical protein